METKKWPMVLFTVTLIFLIYNFLNTIFHSDVKRFSHDRIYVDYSTYQKKDASTAPVPTVQASNFMPVSAQIELARRDMNNGRLESALTAYSSHMEKVFGSRPPPPNAETAVPSQKYEEVMNFARVNIDGFSLAQAAYAKQNYQRALNEYLRIFLNLSENDYHHRMEISEAIAECYFNLKNQKGYVEYKVKYIKAAQQIRELTKLAYPNRPEAPFEGVVSSQEATQQLLKVRAFAASLPANRGEPLIRRAEYDLAVARGL
ncbi:MAG: hypothetical protein HQM08_02315 [Candidatus Riflebacteria bacterium]|nr:hypothetical protein [Candidatus Riflebacteria bacterium]